MEIHTHTHTHRRLQVERKWREKEAKLKEAKTLRDEVRGDLSAQTHSHP